MFVGLIRSLRPASWVKNVFVLAPLVFGKKVADPTSAGPALLAFVAFCFASSAVYLVNDIRDRELDRKHPLKRLRPVAAGTVPVGLAWIAAGVLTAAALGGGFALGIPFTTILASYLLLNLLYTFWLKTVVILDVMIVSFGFLLRVLGGAQAARVEVSSWLWLSTIFLSLFLVFSKRRHELMLLDRNAADQRRVLSQYSPTFLDQMINVVTASSVLAYALYAIDPDTVEYFGSANLVYTVPLVLFGVFRYLYLLYQRPQSRNPTEVILTDPPFILNLGLWGAAVMWIVYG